ncbi:BA75_00730T0 [Komagataella pastoris]|uniref:BA75_00730T0 n=1 Tax=Komagataella pastoris TaxID=4922 RepID=A0A1B2J882_PICPA|nr:BA75_00730T0 [Komagataella pastoris]
MKHRASKLSPKDIAPAQNHISFIKNNIKFYHPNYVHNISTMNMVVPLFMRDIFHLKSPLMVYGNEGYLLARYNVMMLGNYPIERIRVTGRLESEVMRDNYDILVINDHSKSNLFLNCKVEHSEYLRAGLNWGRNHDLLLQLTGVITLNREGIQTFEVSNIEIVGNANSISTEVKYWKEYLDFREIISQPLELGEDDVVDLCNATQDDEKENDIQESVGNGQENETERKTKAKTNTIREKDNNRRSNDNEAAKEKELLKEKPTHRDKETTKKKIQVTDRDKKLKQRKRKHRQNSNNDIHAMANKNIGPITSKEDTPCIELIELDTDEEEQPAIAVIELKDCQEVSDLTVTQVEIAFIKWCISNNKKNFKFYEVLLDEALLKLLERCKDYDNMTLISKIRDNLVRENMVQFDEVSLVLNVNNLLHLNVMLSRMIKKMEIEVRSSACKERNLVVSKMIETFNSVYKTNLQNHDIINDLIRWKIGYGTSSYKWRFDDVRWIFAKV